MRALCLAIAACALARLAEAYTPKQSAASLSGRSAASASPPPHPSYAPPHPTGRHYPAVPPLPPSPPASPPPPPYATADCSRCGFNAEGIANCCSSGGNWQGTCGDGLKHTWEEGFNACKGIAALAGGLDVKEGAGEIAEANPGAEPAWALAHTPPPPPAEHGTQKALHPAPGRNATLEQQLRVALLSELDPHVPPSTGVHGVRISVQFRIFKVIKVDIASGELSLKIWRRSVWYDPRLKWDPDEWGGIRSFRVYPTKQGEQVDDQLWLPPIVTTNTIAREPDTLEMGGAWIKSDGRVWHSVPGIIDLSCRFTGLVSFPADHLSCPMELASWTHSDKVVNLTYFTDDLPWGWPDAPYAKGSVWTNMGPNRPAERGNGIGPPAELVNGALVSALRTKMAQTRALPGVPSRTVEFTAEEFDALGVMGVRRNHYAKVDGDYYVSQDPLPCAEMGAQSPASGSSYQVRLLLPDPS